MSFITNLLARHTSPDRNVKPRVRSRFETASSGGFAGDGFMDQEADKTNSFSFDQENNTFDKSQNETGQFASEFDQNKIQNNRIHPTEKTLFNAKAPEGFDNAAATSNSDPNNFMANITTNKKEGWLDSFVTSVSNGLIKNEEQQQKENKSANGIVPIQHINQETLAEQNKQNEPRDYLVEFNPNNNQERNLKNEASTGRKDNDENAFNPTINKSKETLDNSPIMASIKKPMPPDSFQNERIVPNVKKFAGEEPWKQDIKNLSDKLFNTQKPPTINVTIGRIEVRALVQPVPAPVKNRPSAKSQMSLEDYLKQQNTHAR